MKYKKHKTNEMINPMTKTINDIERLILRIKTIYETPNGVFIQAFDRDLFGNKTQEEISNHIDDILMKEYSITLCTSTIIINDDYVIAIGYVNEIEFMDRKEVEKQC